LHFVAKLHTPERIPIIRGKNRLVFFYPSKNGCHKFTQEDELPFESIVAKGIIEASNGRIVMFPTTKGLVRDTYIMDTSELEPGRLGLITKGSNMLK
jgi:hypothetical protein